MKASCWQLDRHIQPPKVDPAKRQRQLSLLTMRETKRLAKRLRQNDWSRARVK